MDYEFRNDECFIQLLSFLYEVEYLLIDDLGIFLNEKSETQRKAADSLINLMKERKRRNKITIITMTLNDKYGSIISGFAEYLKKHHRVLYTGDANIRQYYNKDLDHKDQKTELNTKFYALGKGWLEQKFNYIDMGIDRAIDIAVVPEDEYHAVFRRSREQFGITTTKSEDLLETLNEVKEMFKKYTGFIMSCDFETILFYDNGNVKVIK